MPPTRRPPRPRLPHHQTCVSDVFISASVQFTAQRSLESKKLLMQMRNGIRGRRSAHRSGTGAVRTASMLLGRVHAGRTPGKGHASHPQLPGPCPASMVSALPPCGAGSGSPLRRQFHCRKDPPLGRVSVHLVPPLKTIASPFPLPGGPSESSAGVVVIPGHTADPGQSKIRAWLPQWCDGWDTCSLRGRQDGQGQLLRVSAKHLPTQRRSACVSTTRHSHVQCPV